MIRDFSRAGRKYVDLEIIGVLRDVQMKKTTCYTYFMIRGDFDPDEITAILGIQPVRSFRSGEPVFYMKDGQKTDTGRTHQCSCWEGCRCDEYDVIISNQMEMTIEPLIPRIEQLNMIRERFDASLTLEVVPSICCEHEKPCISPSMKVIDFCSEVRADLDIDWYIDNA